MHNKETPGKRGDRRRIGRCAWFLALLFSGVMAAQALGPHQVVVVVNRHAPDSQTVADHYVKIRGIPPSHVIAVEVPEKSLKPPYAISRDEFMSAIFTPVEAAIKERNLPPIYAWIYSVGFPTKVSTGSTDDLSIHGMTFLRGRVPSASEVKQGKYASPLFAGPEMPKGTVSAARSFDVSMRGALENYPIPSMSLGFIGPGGSTLESVLRCLTRGGLSDGSAPGGTVYLIKNSDVRSTARDWQFAPIQGILTKMNIRCQVLTNEISGKTDILGLQNGRTHIDAVGYGRYLPGAMAEHLTSFGAGFDDPGQTHCTDWINAGATASSGTITEPYAIWTKFPAATFYVYYAQGCTVIESFYQSVKCPLQLFMVGDPLASPWRRMFSLTLVSLEDGPLSGMADFFVQVFPAPPPGAGIRFRAYLDGVPVFQPPMASGISLDTRKVSNGVHRLRVVAEFGGNVTWSAYDELTFEVKNEE
ncbi:MAG: hypothetical protein PHP44_04050 [Kiritimatiellae bacterium]|nr:hypothetical protein [Kiritimatiellia bacterium]